VKVLRYSDRQGLRHVRSGVLVGIPCRLWPGQNTAGRLSQFSRPAVCHDKQSPKDTPD